VLYISFSLGYYLGIQGLGRQLGPSVHLPKSIHKFFIFTGTVKSLCTALLGNQKIVVLMAGCCCSEPTSKVVVVKVEYFFYWEVIVNSSLTVYLLIVLTIAVQSEYKEYIK
jgi:hypothetical protein